MNHETETPLRTSTRVKRPVERYEEWVYNANSTVTKAEPTSLSEALERKDCKLWKEAADSEFKSLVENEVWNLKKLPEGRKAIGCKWIFKRKLKPDGTFERYKARLVAQGYNQVYGEDYDEVFVPVARFESIRTVVSQAVKGENENSPDGCNRCIFEW